MKFCLAGEPGEGGASCVGGFRLPRGILFRWNAGVGLVAQRKRRMKVGGYLGALGGGWLDWVPSAGAHSLERFSFAGSSDLHR